MNLHLYTLVWDSCLLDICPPSTHEDGHLPTTKLEHEFLFRFCFCVCQGGVCVCVCVYI